MKIIAQTPNDRILVSLQMDELANLIGEYSKYDVKTAFINDSIKNDTEIQISDIYVKHKLIVGLQSQSEYESARAQLNKLLKALTPIENKVLALSNNAAAITQKK